MSFSRREGERGGMVGGAGDVDGMKRWTGLMSEIHQLIGILKLKTPSRDN
jgi:hypothetical protein